MADDSTLHISIIADDGGATSTLKSVAQSLGDVGSGASDAGGGLSSFTGLLGGMGEGAGGAAEAVSGLGGATALLGPEAEIAKEAFEVLMSVIENFIAPCVELAAAFDMQLTKLRALAGDGAETKQTYEDLGNAALDIGKKTQYSSDLAVMGMNVLRNTGQDLVSVIGEALPAAYLAEAEGAKNMDQTAKTLGDTMNVFKLQASDAQHVVDVLAKAYQLTGLSTIDFAAALKNTGQIAAQFGTSMEEMTAAIELQTRAGISASQAGINLRNLYSSFQKPTKAAAEELQALGVQLYDAQGKFLGLQNVMEQVDRATAKMTDEERNHALALLGNKNALAAYQATFGSVITVQTEFGPVMMKGTEALKGLTHELQNADGTTEKLATTLRESLEMQMKNLEGSMKEFQITVGKAFLPGLQKITKDAGEELNKLITGTQQGIADFGRGFTGILNVLDKVIKPIIDGIVTGIGNMVTDIGKAFGDLGENIDGATPFIENAGKVIGGVLTVALTFLGKTISTTIGLAASFVGAVKNIVTVVVEVGTKIKDFLQPVIDTITGLASGVADIVSGLFAGMVDKVKDFAGGVKEFLQPAIDFMSKGIATGIKVASDAIKTAGDMIGEITTKIKEFFQPVLDLIQHAIDVGKSLGLIKEHAEPAKQSLDDLKKTVTDSGESMEDLTKQMLIQKDNLDAVSKAYSEGKASQAELDAASKSYQDTLGKLKTAQDQNKTSTDDLKNRVGELKGKYDEAQEAFTKVNQAFKDGKATANDYAAAKKKVSDAEAEYKKASEGTSKALGDQTKATDDTTAATDKLDESLKQIDPEKVEAAAEKVQEAQDKVVEAQDKLADAQDNLKAKTEATTEALNEANAAAAQLTQITEQLKEATDEYNAALSGETALKNATTYSDADLKDLEAQMTLLKSGSGGEASGKAKSAKDELAKIQNQYDHATGDAKAKLYDQLKEARDAYASASKDSQPIDDLQKKIDQKKAELEHNQAAAERNQPKTDQAKDLYEKVKQQQADIAKEAAKTADAYKKAAGEETTAQKQVETAQDNVKKSQEGLTSQQTAYEKAATTATKSVANATTQSAKEVATSSEQETTTATGKMAETGQNAEKQVSESGKQIETTTKDTTKSISDTLLQTMSDSLKTLTENSKQNFKDLTDISKQGFKDVTDGLKENAKTVVDGISNVVKEGNDKISTNLVDLRASLDKFTSEIGKQLEGITKTATDAVSKGLTEVKSGLSDISKAVTSVDDELKNMAASTKEQTSALNKLSGDTATGFDGLKAILTDIRDLIKSLVDEMKNSLTQAGSGNTSGTGDQNSLPGQANSLGENLATGLAKGIKSGIPSVKNSFNLLNSAVSDSLNAMNVIGLAGHNLTQAPQAQGDAQTVDGGTLGWSSAGDGSGSSGNSGSSPSLGGSGSSGNSGSSTSSGGFGDVVTNVNLDGKQIAQNVTDNQQTQKQRQLGSGFQAGLF